LIVALYCITFFTFAIIYPSQCPLFIYLFLSSLPFFFLLSLSFSLSVVLEVCAQGLELARQALYHLSHALSPFLP
jgi:hypothetical protein